MACAEHRILASLPTCTRCGEDGPSIRMPVGPTSGQEGGLVGTSFRHFGHHTTLYGKAFVHVDDAPLQKDIHFMDEDVGDQVLGTNLRRLGMMGVADMEQYAKGGRWGQLDIRGPMKEDDQNIERNVDMDDNIGNESMATRVRPRKRIVQPLVTQLDQDSYNVIEEYKNEEVNGTLGPIGIEDPRHIFRDETWSQACFTHDPKPLEFDECSSTTTSYEALSSMLHLWKLFWPYELMKKIVRESNQYAATPMDDLENTIGGSHWKSLTIVELKAFIAIHFYMGLKKQANINTYWKKAGFIFY